MSFRFCPSSSDLSLSIVFDNPLVGYESELLLEPFTRDTATAKPLKNVTGIDIHNSLAKEKKKWGKKKIDAGRCFCSFRFDDEDHLPPFYRSIDV